MTLSADELWTWPYWYYIRDYLVTKLLNYIPSYSIKREVVWIYCEWEIQVSILRLELKLSPMQCKIQLKNKVLNINILLYIHLSRDVDPDWSMRIRIHLTHCVSNLSLYLTHYVSNLSRGQDIRLWRDRFVWWKPTELVPDRAGAQVQWLCRC